MTAHERETLERCARREKSARALAQWCRIVLAYADGVSEVEASEQLRVRRTTVGKWRSRFTTGRLEALVEEERPGRPPSITPDRIEEAVVTTLEEIPRDATHWSRTSMVDRTGSSPSTIGRIWRDFGLRPHHAGTFKPSTDPLFSEKVVDVLGLHHDPPERAVVLCVDEKSRIQALDRSQPVPPMMPGMPNAAPKTTSATASPACSPPSASPKAPWSASCNAGTAPPSSASS